MEVNRARLSCQRYEDFKIFILFAEFEEIDFKEIELVSKEVYYCIQGLCELSIYWIYLMQACEESKKMNRSLSSNAIGLGTFSTA